MHHDNQTNLSIDISSILYECKKDVQSFLRSPTPSLKEGKIPERRRFIAKACGSVLGCTVILGDTASNFAYICDAISKIIKIFNTSPNGKRLNVVDSIYWAEMAISSSKTMWITFKDWKYAQISNASNMFHADPSGDIKVVNMGKDLNKREIENIAFCILATVNSHFEYDPTLNKPLIEEDDDGN